VPAAAVAAPEPLLVASATSPDPDTQAARGVAPKPGGQEAQADPSPPRLVVVRGPKRGLEYPIYPDLNFIGRADEKPVDIDLEPLEEPDCIWSSRQHAVIALQDGAMTIEDLHSANGTYVNRARVPPGEKRPLNPGDLIQIGTVQLQVSG
jgi:hypothetical protein